MFKITCPQCKVKTAIGPRGFRNWFRSERPCRACGANLEMTNPLLVGGLFGLVLGCLPWALSAVVGTEWAAGLLLALPVILLLFRYAILPLGKWRVVPDSLPDCQAYKTWIRVSWIADGLGIVVLFVSPWAFFGQFHDMAEPSAGAAGLQNGADPMARIESLIHQYYACMAFGFALLAIGIVAGLVSRRIRSKQISQADDLAQVAPDAPH